MTENFILLKFLWELKRLMLLMLIIANPGCFADEKKSYDHNHTLYNKVLQQFVKNGQVDYAELKKNPQPLERYLFKINRVDKQQFNKWQKNQQLALLINLYNAATLKLIIDNYPVTSIKKIGTVFKGPWDQPVVKLFDTTITLNHLEHQIIRKRYNEPRIHLALVCAAKGCPPLRNEAYIAEKLDEQLNDQTKQFLSNRLNFKINRQAKVVYLSPIFKWYGNDFRLSHTPEKGYNGLNKTDQAVVNFCSLYLSASEQKFLSAGDYSIKFLNYDWSLNAN
jgi:Protein of unknown function, DUF547